ncbi:MAG: TIGR03960 family B12-binding radical SAM protein [Anaerolineae bacterium]
MRVDSYILDRILPTVQKPGRYTGGEYNSIVKDWDVIDVKVALAFPDIYDLGMSNLGLAILYDILNRETDVLAERVYVPWPDMEAAMRHAGLPLYSLETHHALRDFDLVGISLPYEQLYSNVLTLLDLGEMPLLSEMRDERYPLVLAGGNAVFNPEPMADFIDFFVLGEGEQVILEIVEAYREVRGADRETQLRRMAQIPGIYVPRFYTPSYFEDGTLARIEPLVEEAAAHIVKRITPVMPPAVTRFIVPFVDVVFNRASIEIQRGCTRGCRFCQAGMVFRPVRERSMEEIMETVDAIVRETGYEEIGLLSLSSTDYTRIGPLVKALSEKYRDRNLSLSLPSSRVESVTVELVDMLAQGRKTGFTFAPEAATDRMRDVINKAIPTQELLEVAEMVYSRNWRLIKLYFMIGQPTETEEDVRAIARLARQVLEIGQRYHGRKAQVRVGVSTFVPKPHTPFQWAALDDLDTIRHKQAILKEEFREASYRSSARKGIIYNWNEPEESLLEASLGRGDRRVGRAILLAWQKGCKFDAWHEHFRPDLWRQAFEEAGLDQAWYANRPRLADEVFPWDHIDAGVQKRWLLMDWYAAQRGETKIDCREHCFNCGILTAFKGLRALTPPEAWECPPIRNPRWKQLAQQGEIIGLTPAVEDLMLKAKSDR